MASGLSSAFSRSDINSLSRETLHTSSNAAEEPKWKDRLSEVSPVDKENWFYSCMMEELKQMFVEMKDDFPAAVI